MALGAKLAQKSKSGDVIYLIGELGAGKTTLVRGFLRSLGHKGKVKSPTYTLVEPYEIVGKKIYHFDLYRLLDPEELEHIGIRDYFTDKSICLIEWPERAYNMLPSANIICTIEIIELGRKVDVKT